MKIVHAKSYAGIDYTLCGDAYEEFDNNGDFVEEGVIAEVGQRVTCETCKSIIDYCHKFYKYIQPPD